MRLCLVSRSLLFAFVIHQSSAEESLMTLETLTAQCNPISNGTQTIPLTIRNVGTSATSDLSLEKNFLLTLRRFSNISGNNQFNMHSASGLLADGDLLNLASLAYENNTAKQIRILGFETHKSENRFFGIREMYSGVANASLETFQEIKYSLVPDSKSLTDFKIITNLSGKSVAVHECSLYKDTDTQEAQQIDFFNSTPYRVGTYYFALANVYEPVWTMYARKLHIKLVTLPTYGGSLAKIDCKQSASEFQGKFKFPSEVVLSISSFANSGSGTLSTKTHKNSITYTKNFDIPAITQDKHGIRFTYLASLSEAGNDPNKDSYAVTTIDAVKASANGKFKLLSDLAFNKNTSLNVDVYNGIFSKSSSYKVNFKFLVNNCIY